MSCSPFDLRDYLLQELDAPQQRQVEAHVRICEPCREEAERLRMTESTLLALREEEIPQRIAFVSDKIFEPSPWRRGWSAFWGSTARLSFASAAMLSISLVVFALTRPVPAPVATGTVPITTISTVFNNADIDRRIQAAVGQAVAESETRQAQKTERLIADLERRNVEARNQLVAAGQVIDYLNMKGNAVRSAAFRSPENGGLNQ
jgi:anti-sigma factor RsiW